MKTFIAFIVICGALLPVKASVTSKQCLMANEIDKESITQSHLTVEILEETNLWYVTGRVWDHLNHEWVDFDYRIVDKQRATDLITKVECPQ